MAEKEITILAGGRTRRVWEPAAWRKVQIPPPAVLLQVAVSAQRLRETLGDASTERLDHPSVMVWMEVTTFEKELFRHESSDMNDFFKVSIMEIAAQVEAQPLGWTLWINPIHGV